MLEGIAERMLLEALKHAAIGQLGSAGCTPAPGMPIFSQQRPESIGDLLANPVTKAAVTVPRSTMVIRYAVFTDPVRLGPPSIADVASLIASACEHGVPSNLLPLTRVETASSHRSSEKAYAYLSIFRRPDGAHVLDVSRALPNDVIVVAKRSDGKFINISDLLRGGYHKSEFSLLDERRIGIPSNSEIGIFKPISPRTGDFLGWLTHVVNREVPVS